MGRRKCWWPFDLFGNVAAFRQQQHAGSRPIFVKSRRGPRPQTYGSAGMCHRTTPFRFAESRHWSDSKPSRQPDSRPPPVAAATASSTCRGMCRSAPAAARLPDTRSRYRTTAPRAGPPRWPARPAPATRIRGLPPTRPDTTGCRPLTAWAPATPPVSRTPPRAISRPTRRRCRARRFPQAAPASCSPSARALSS